VLLYQSVERCLVGLPINPLVLHEVLPANVADSGLVKGDGLMRLR
jgi:hypothetical protein